jgi:hypothetical protein
VSDFGDEVKRVLKMAKVYGMWLKKIPARIDVLEDLAEAVKRYRAYPNTIREKCEARRDMDQFLATLEKM